MADLVFILIIVAFFMLCAAYVRGLDRLVRASEEVELTDKDATPFWEVTQ